MNDIIYTKKYGLANTINNKIYLHPILNDYPSLKEKVIKHEREHQKSKGFLKNRKVDALTEITFKDLLPVYKRKPFLFFKQHSPILYIDNTLFIEWSIIFLILFYIGIIFLIKWIISIFSADSKFAIKVLINMGWITGIVIILYILGKKLKNYLNQEFERISKEKA